MLHCTSDVEGNAFSYNDCLCQGGVLGLAGIFDPFGFSKGNLKEMQTREIKNGRCAALCMLAQGTSWACWAN